MFDWITELSIYERVTASIELFDIIFIGIIFPILFYFFTKGKRSQNTGNNKGPTTIGVPFEQFTRELEKKEHEIRALLVDKAISQHEKNQLSRQLAEIEKLSLDKQASYEAYIKDLQQSITELSALTGEIPQALLDDAIAALAAGETEKADKLLAQVAQQAQTHIDAAAEAAYQRAKIAEDNLKYTAAFDYARRAVQLSPEKSRYLNKAGLLAQTLGDADKAIRYFEQALDSDLKTFGDNHPEVATDRNNLGSAWRDKGEFDKAIRYFEQALQSGLKTFGDDHPRVATMRHNLASAIQLMARD